MEAASPLNRPSSPPITHKRPQPSARVTCRSNQGLPMGLKAFAFIVSTAEAVQSHSCTYIRVHIAVMPRTSKERQEGSDCVGSDTPRLPEMMGPAKTSQWRDKKVGFSQPGFVGLQVTTAQGTSRITTPRKKQSSLGYNPRLDWVAVDYVVLRRNGLQASF